MAYRPTKTAVRFLLSDEGHGWLEHSANLVGTPTSHLADLSRLRQYLAPDEAAAIMEQVQLRARAAPRFERAAQMLFTDAGLQQSTHPLVASHRAERFRHCTLVADLGCGLGSDTLALAQAVDHVIAVDRDPIRLKFARRNTFVYGLAERVTFTQADILALPFAPRNMHLFCDPGRRTGTGRRIFKPDDYEPALAFLEQHLAGAKGLAIKVAPGIPYATLSWVGEVEIVSLKGEVKEATLWCGDQATPGVRRRATLLPSGATITDNATQTTEPCSVKPAGRYLFEPDGAVIRAGLVQQAAVTLGLWQLDGRIAYLSGDSPVVSPLVQGFKIQEQLTLNLKTLRRRLHELGVGVLEIKKRGVALDPDAFRRGLKLKGVQSKTLIVTRIGDRPVAFLCQRTKTRDAREASRV